MEFRLAHPEYALLFWLVPAVLLLFRFGMRRRRAAAARFDGSNPEERGLSSGRWVSALFVTLAAAAGIFAACGPEWNLRERTVRASGRDVVFLVDSSKSMLAADLYPNRLERAKLAILDTVPELRGDRVSLVAFAGTAVVKCPLTTDYAFFSDAVESLSVYEISRGGSLIGDAVRKVLNQVLDAGNPGTSDIILITDGEDQESFPVEAARMAGSAGVRILAVGLGSEGSPIPTEEGGYLSYRGETVRSGLDADTLREMASATPGGGYLHVATGTFDLAEVYRRMVLTAAGYEYDHGTVVEWDKRYGIFALVAAVCIGISLLVPHGRAKECG